MKYRRTLITVLFKKKKEKEREREFDSFILE